MVVSVLLIIITTYFQYNATFLATYVESGIRRRTLAEKLRKIPLSFFGKKDLSDLTNTIMGDCAWLETASSHFFPQLFGSMCSTTIVMICLFFFNVKMTLMAGLNKKIQAVEKHAVVSEAINAMFVCMSQLILKVGIGTTALVGGILFATGSIREFISNHFHRHTVQTNG